MEHINIIQDAESDCFLDLTYQRGTGIKHRHYMDKCSAEKLQRELSELLNIPDEISRLKALLISEKRKYLQRFEDDSYEGRKTTRQSLESFINQHNLK